MPQELPELDSLPRLAHALPPSVREDFTCLIGEEAKATASTRQSLAVTPPHLSLLSP